LYTVRLACHETSLEANRHLCNAPKAAPALAIGVPFVDGMNRPILCKTAGISFEGWVEILPDDSSFYLGCNFQSHQESPNLVSGSDLTNASPLLVKLQYEDHANGPTNLYETRDAGDQFTSFVAVDSVLRILPNGDCVSSV
jgi:hypothetical protein